MNGNGTGAVITVPHSVQAEEAVLGAALIDGDLVSELMRVLKPGDFFIQRHEWIFTAICRLSDRDQTIDYLTVIEALNESNKLEEIGGPAYLMHLANSTPTSAHGLAYAEIVRRSAVRRRLMEAASKIATLANQETDNIDTVLNDAEALVMAVRDRNQSNECTLTEAVNRAMDQVIALSENDNADALLGIPTGFKEYDNNIGGLFPGEVIIVAAPPGAGKTSWMMSMIRHQIRHKFKAGLFSLEMSAGELSGRWIAMETGLTVTKQRQRMADDELQIYMNGVHRLSESSARLRLDTTPGITLAQLRATARRWVQRHGVQIIYIDYIGLMTMARAESRNIEVGMVSKGIKELARELNVPIVIASQLSREYARRQDKRPILSDLRDSGSLEQDADVIAFLYRPWLFDKTQKPSLAEMNIAKCRQGDPGNTVPLYFNAPRTMFENARVESINLKALVNNGR